jgi:signal transduction histidine kinase
VVVSIAYAIATFLFTHEQIYKLGSVQVGLQVLCLILLSGLVAFAYHNRKVQLAAQAEARTALTTQQTLVQERNTFVGQAAGVLADDYESIELASRDLKAVPQAKPFFGGLTMLQSLTTSLTNVQRFTKVARDAPQLNVSEEVARSLASLQTAAQAKQLTITSNIPANLKVQLQPEEFKQLTQSIIQNAIQFSPEQGAVTLSARQSHDLVELTVSGHGAGIPSAQLDQLFAPFSRATDAQTFDNQGLGMNLHVDKLITDKVGGGIKLASSTAAGKSGTSVTISLPVAKAEATSPVLIAPSTSPS